MAYHETMRLTIPPRMVTTFYEPSTPAHVSLSKLRGKWYFRPLWWFLQKLGAEYQDRIPESYPLQTIAINHESIRELLSSSQRALDTLWQKKATTLVIGHDEMEKLVGAAFSEPAVFRMPFPMQKWVSRNPDLPPEAQMITRDLRVVLAPWLSGWALLPDLEYPPQARGDY